MKKIILTGVVLILLILLAVDFYVGNRRANDRKETAMTTTISDNTAAASAAVASPVTDESAISADDGNVTTTTATTTRVRRHTRMPKPITPVDQSLAGNMPEDDGGITVIMERDEVPVAVETTKEFTGNKPVVVEKKFVIKEIPRHMVHFGVEGGIQQNCFDNSGSSNKLQLGFHAGVLADVAFGEHFAIQPGARYSLKGIGVHTIASQGNVDVDTRNRISLNYIEVPVNFVVKFGKRENARVMLGAGPYVAYLVSARDRYEITTTTYNVNDNPAARTTASQDNVPGTVKVTQGDRSVPVGSNGNSNTAAGPADAGSMRAWDWGVGGFVGVEAPGGLFIKAGAQRGLMNIQHKADGTYASNNCNYFVSVGYLIGYRK